MIRTLCLALVALLILTAGCVNVNTRELTDEDLAQLESTRELLAEAMLAGDVDAISEIYTDDYRLVNRKGLLRTRAERLKMLESGKLKYLRLGDEVDVTINTYGNVALVRGAISAAEIEFDGVTRETDARRFTAIWVYEGGEWRQAGRQHTIIAEEAP
jgi:ketosteroid isomerase-like protein